MTVQVEKMNWKLMVSVLLTGVMAQQNYGMILSPRTIKILCMDSSYVKRLVAQYNYIWCEFSRLNMFIIISQFFCFKCQTVDKEKKENVFADDAYLMVSQLHWEDDVIWNGADVLPEVLTVCDNYFSYSRMSHSLLSE